MISPPRAEIVGARRSHAKSSLREKLMSFCLIYHVRLAMHDCKNERYSDPRGKKRERERDGEMEKKFRCLSIAFVSCFVRRHRSRNIKTGIIKWFKRATCRSPPSIHLARGFQRSDFLMQARSRMDINFPGYITAALYATPNEKGIRYDETLSGNK